VNPAEDDEGAAPASDSADLVAAEGVEGMNADTDDIAGLEAGWIHRTERFIGDRRIAKGGRRCGGNHVDPSWRDHGGAKRYATGIYEANLHERTLIGV
jgi:hypothetical protein